MPGNITTFNILDGFAEGILRGFRLGFLTEAEFHHIVQCDNLEDVKLNLSETDYGNFLQNEPSPLSPSTIRDRALDKLVLEFQYLRSQANEELGKFLDFIVKDYMIDNVMLILKATLNNPNVNVRELIEQAHPLGQFSQANLKMMTKFENTPAGFANLYQTVLIDTPIGPYIERFLQDLKSEENGRYGGGSGGGDVRNILEEMPTVKLENALRKLYLEDFYNFCESLEGDTADNMRSLLKARADATAINITLNSFGTSLNADNAVEDRYMLLPSIGHLYPEGTSLLKRVHSEEELVEVLKGYPDYAAVLAKYVAGESTVDDAFYEREVMLCETAFEGQFNYAPFYAYVRLKEQEIRNLVWVCETIVQKQKSKVGQHYIPIFSKTSPWRKPAV